LKVNASSRKNGKEDLVKKEDRDHNQRRKEHLREKGPGILYSKEVHWLLQGKRGDEENKK